MCDKKPIPAKVSLGRPCMHGNTHMVGEFMSANSDKKKEFNGNAQWISNLIKFMRLASSPIEGICCEHADHHVS